MKRQEETTSAQSGDSGNGAPPVASHVKARIEAFRSELGNILSGELSTLEREFEDQIQSMSTQMKSLSDGLRDARGESTKRASDLTRMKLEQAAERERFSSEVSRLERKVAEREKETEQHRRASEEAQTRLAALQTEIRERVASMEALERRFQDELALRDRQLQEMAALNDRYERKLHALLEVQKRLDEALGHH